MLPIFPKGLARSGSRTGCPGCRRRRAACSWHGRHLDRPRCRASLSQPGRPGRPSSSNSP